MRYQFKEDENTLLRYSFGHVFVLRSVSKRCPSNSPDMKFSNILLLFLFFYSFFVCRRVHFGLETRSCAHSLWLWTDFLAVMLLVLFQNNSFFFNAFSIQMRHRKYIKLWSDSRDARMPSAKIKWQTWTEKTIHWNVEKELNGIKWN